ncbi:MAG: glycosyltransferase family 4 protein [Cyclobacteriaceae bacterium]
MKILELCLASSLGGLELYFHRCCRYFSQSEYTLLSAVAPGTRLAKLAQQDRIEHVELPAVGWSTLLPRAKELALLLVKHQIDVLHVHHKHDLPLVALAKRLSSQPVLVVHTRQMQLYHSKKDLYHRWVYGAIDIFIAITDQVQQQIRSNVATSPEQVVRLYYGVDPPKLVESLPELPPLPSADGQIGIFSRIERLKGQHLVLEALKLLNQQETKVNAYFYGDVMDEAYVQGLKEYVKSNDLSDQVCFAGFHPQPTQLMPQMNIVVMPSLDETFGLTLVEAMRCGVAVIGTNNGGIPEIIDDEQTGLLFERENSKQLATQISRLIKSPELRNQLALAGKSKADQEFDAAQHFSNLSQLFQSHLTYQNEDITEPHR